MFAGQTFLITGGTGSFGKTLVEHLIKTDIAKIIILSRDEAKQHFMREEFPDSRLRLVLGDVRNTHTVKTVLQGVDFVFHAAALKQVPASESFPWEFVQTNVVGSQNVISNLESAGVKKAIFLSTDKAVYPVNAMGISKAMMEKLVRAEHQGATTCPIITRYGNVIGSRGSVIPGFLKSIRDDGSVNITDGSMTRFMMSLKESVELVLFALENGNSGDLFVQKAPASTVDTLVDSLEILTNRKIKRNYVGVRPGEKIHESLLTAEEMARATETTNYFQVPRLQAQTTNTNLTFQEYSSNSTTMLSALELSDMLNGIPEIRKLIQEI